MQYRTLDTHGRDLVDIVMQKEAERVNFPSTTQVVSGRQVVDNMLTLRVYRQKSAAGLGSYLSDESDKDYELMRFAATPVSEKADFCVKVKGDSMEPKIADEDIVFVKAVPKVDADNVGIFVYDGEAYCKRLRIDHRRGAVVLESLNKSYAPKQIENPELLRTVGLVIGISE
jgi:phage repressor protein C with HTH and peptisase S24 domain